MIITADASSSGQCTGDAEVIIDMARALATAVGDPEPRLTVEDLVRDGSGSGRWFDCFVAEADGALVEYALACKAYEAHTGNRRLWLGNLYVRPDARGNGTGRALVAAVARHAAELRCDAIYWELWRLNEGGGAFYKRLGAEEIADLAAMRLGGPLLWRDGYITIISAIAPRGATMCWTMYPLA